MYMGVPLSVLGVVPSPDLTFGCWMPLSPSARLPGATHSAWPFLDVKSPMTDVVEEHVVGTSVERSSGSEACGRRKCRILLPLLARYQKLHAGALFRSMEDRIANGSIAFIWDKEKSHYSQP